MLKIIITGAAGRMGRRLVANIAMDNDLKLVGATEYPGSEFIGQDAGSVAGVGELNVPILEDMDIALNTADVIVDFSTGNVLNNVKLAVEHGIGIVIGTTALTEQDLEEINTLAQQGGKIVLSTNYSVGVNLLFYLSELTARILPDDFDIEVIEAHHNKKKDAPSGTAMTLAQILCASRKLSIDEDLRHGRVGIVGARTTQEIGVHSIRGGDIVGDHTVMFASEGERIELIHRASSRDTFARGALRAARFIADVQEGGRIFSMQDVLAEMLAAAAEEA